MEQSSDMVRMGLEVTGSAHMAGLGGTEGLHL